MAGPTSTLAGGGDQQPRLAETAHRLLLLFDGDVSERLAHQMDSGDAVEPGVGQDDVVARRVVSGRVRDGHPDWALAMRLTSRSGLRWGELIALRPCDLVFSPKHTIAVLRAVEQSRKGFAIKTTKNRQRARRPPGLV